MGTLKSRLPISVPDSLDDELQKIAFRFEDKIYTAAASLADYLNKISLKMVSMEFKSPHPRGPGQINPSINQNPVDPATLDSIAPTGHVAVVDLQEEIYQKIRSMKVLYYADLNELHQRISLKLRQNDGLPSAKAAEQFEKMKGFKMMLERTLQILLISKANISPSMKDKIPLYEKQIQNILASNKKKGIPSQAPGQQQFQHPRSHSQLVQQQQQTQISQLQQHDNYANQQNNIQGSSNSMQTPAVQNMQHGSVPLSAHFGVTSQQKISNALQTGSTVDPVQGNSFSSLQQGAIAPMQQGGLVMPIAPMQRSSSNAIQQQHFKQEQKHLMSNPQLKQQLQQRHVQQHLLQQQQKQQLLQAQQPLQQHVQQQQQKQHQTSQMPLHQMQQLHQSNEVSDLKLRQAPGIKPGLYQQHYSTTQRHGYYQVKPATLDSIAPTGHVAIDDLQEEIYQKIRSMKDLYYADLNELHQLSLKFQQNDALPSAKAAEQFEKMKGFKMMLERALQILLISKANISPSMKDKIPMFEKKIQNIILFAKKKKVIPSQAPGQQQFQHPSSHSQLVQQQQQTQVSQLQQHDNYANQQNNIQATLVDSIAPTGDDADADADADSDDDSDADADLQKIIQEI